MPLIIQQSEVYLTKPPLFVAVVKITRAGSFVCLRSFPSSKGDFCCQAKWINLPCRFRPCFLGAHRGTPVCTHAAYFSKRGMKSDTFQVHVWRFSFRAHDYDRRCPSSSKTEVEIQTCVGLKLKLAITFNDAGVGEGRDAEHGRGKCFSFMGERVPLLFILPPLLLGCGYNGQRKTKALKCRAESPSVY